MGSGEWSIKTKLDVADRYVNSGFKKTSLRDLNHGIDLIHDAMRRVSPGQHGHAMCLVSLATALRLRYEQTSNGQDLEDAIATSQTVAKALAETDPAMPIVLDTLASAWINRFEQSSHPDDLSAGIAAFREAVASPALERRLVAGATSNLANALRSRYVLTRNPADLDEAIELGTRALTLRSVPRASRASILTGLADSFRMRYELPGHPGDLDPAIGHGEQAVSLTKDRESQRGLRLNTLGVALRMRAQETGRRIDLNRAVEVAQLAVNATPADGPFLALWLANLAEVLILRYQRLGQPADLPRAITAGQQGAAMTSASPKMRARAARRWAEALAAGERWSEACDVFAAAIELLDEVAPRDLDRIGQELQLDSLSGLGPDAAACCVRAGDAGRAIELFERGRGVLLGQALDTRTSEAAPGHPLSAAQLCSAAAGGHVAVVIVSRLGSCALILDSGGVKEPVSLPALTPEVTLTQVIELLAATVPAASDDEQPAREKRIGEGLGWLWESVAAPVLGRLGIDGPPAHEEPFPRVWWCASGLLSLMPLHAAGLAQDASATVRSRVMSSYTPTIRALIHARQTAPAAAAPAAAAPAASAAASAAPAGRSPAERVAADGQVVAVAMRHTPGARELTEAAAEAEWLCQHRPGRVTVLPDEAATHEAVLGALPGAQWAHFACHGISNAASPSASALLLHDHNQRLLTVLDVARLDLAGAELAFLSACSTARTSPRLADEAISLASAFHVAGYRHVIGTLWPVNDRQAREMAEMIYAALERDETVATAVHEAARSMSLRWFDKPSRWASHVHVGA